MFYKLKIILPKAITCQGYENGSQGCRNGIIYTITAAPDILTQRLGFYSP